ncbi:MAG: hypothetical protein J6V99_02395 [Neisseriaceae bacterium]|nr:hypothetical protein [Neisseriaceae bacterium]
MLYLRFKIFHFTQQFFDCVIVKLYFELHIDSLNKYSACLIFGCSSWRKSLLLERFLLSKIKFKVFGVC